MTPLTLEKLHIRGMTYWTGEPVRICYMEGEMVAAESKYSYMFLLLIELDGHTYREFR